MPDPRASARLLLGLLLLFGCIGGTTAAVASDQPYTVEQLITHADTMYWVAMAERGSLTAIQHGFEYLDQAEEALRDSAHREPERALLQRQIAGVRKDLQYQEELAHNTHYGVFPLARFVAPSLFRDPRSIGSFELIDDPDEVATREALHELVGHVINAQTMTPQYDVVFVHDVIGDNAAAAALAEELQDEALYAFNRSPRFFVHNRLEMERFLATFDARQQPQVRAELGELAPRATTLKKLMDQFNTENLLFVRVRKLDEAHGDYFYIAEGRVFEAEQLAGVPDDAEASSVVKPNRVLNVYGFCIDRRFMLVPIIVLHLLLLAAAIVLYRVLVKITTHAGQAPPWKDAIVMGGICFLWGRILMWVIPPILSAIQPDPETLAWWSFWWPAAAGAAFILGPATVMRVAENRFKLFGDFFVMFNRGGPIFAAVALGSVAFLAQAAMLYKGWSALWIVAPLIVAAPLAAYIVGRASDNTDSVSLHWGIAAAIVTLFLGAAWCHAGWVAVWLCLPLLAVIAYLACKQAAPVKAPVKKQAKRKDAAAEETAPDLVGLACAPPFVESASFQVAKESLEPWVVGRQTVRIAFVGPAGIGKSAIMRALEQQTCAKLLNEVVLRGTCSEPQAGASQEPYEPFVEAIADHFAVNLLAPPADQMKNIDQALGGVFDSVVPFSDILFPPSEHGASGSKKEMFIAIASMIRRLARRGPVLLVVDDAHWMDGASRELLTFLLREFPAGGSFPLAVLLASRTREAVAFDNQPLEIIELQPLTEDELRGILQDGLKLHPQVADAVLGAVGAHEDNLHWVFQIIAHLARSDLFAWYDGGFEWKEENVEIADHLPDDYRHSLQQAISENRQYRTLLECAACVGPEFTVERISHGVGIPRLELIHLLDEVAGKTGMIRDMRHKDDHFAFRSPFMLEVLRKILEVSATGPHEPVSPQRVREYHHRLAVALERTLDDSNTALYTVANHYFAAGARNANKGLEYSLRAAKTATAQFQHDLARKYIEMARVCGSICGANQSDLERSLLLIECHEAHVEGKDRVAVAERGLALLDKNPNAGFEVYRCVALACYDAGIDTRDQTQFANCVRVADEMLRRFNGSLEQAESHHFRGIALPVAETDQRREQLLQAMSLLANAAEDDLPAQRLKSRVANSLGEQLSYGDAADRARAKECFTMGVAIKNREDIRDIEGLAFAHGGLGRLAFFAPEPDVGEARRHFELDLRYSERIGSLAGQSKMHSLLGACDLAESGNDGRFQTALDHYHAALDLAEQRVDQFFALSGLLRCHAGLGQSGQRDQRAAQLVALAQDSLAALPEDARHDNPSFAIPRICSASIKAALEACQDARESQWHRWLTELTENNRNLVDS